MRGTYGSSQSLDANLVPQVFDIPLGSRHSHCENGNEVDNRVEDALLVLRRSVGDRSAVPRLAPGTDIRGPSGQGGPVKPTKKQLQALREALGFTPRYEVSLWVQIMCQMLKGTKS